MTPCKKCDNGDGISGFNIELKNDNSYKYFCTCIKCGSSSERDESVEIAWKNWKNKNKKEYAK